MPAIHRRSNSARGRWQFALASAALVCAQPGHAQSRVEESAKDAKYECPVPESPEALTARVEELYPKKYDRNALGCAADLLATAAGAAPKDVALNIQALLVRSEYIDHVNTLWDYDIYGVRQPEWAARLEHAIPPGKEIAARVAAAAPDDATALCARAYFNLVWPFKSADAKTSLTASRDSIPLLEKAVAREPAALDGVCMLMLGRLYYELPEFAGGDVAKAGTVLSRAHELAPKNVSVTRYLAYTKLQDGDAAAATKLLTGLLDAEPSPLDLQLAADELKNARDLAHRIPAADLEAQLTAKRDALLAAHPELLTRASTAANMHGGVDPITGKSY